MVIVHLCCFVLLVFNDLSQLSLG